MSDGAYGAYGRGAVEPGDRPAVIVVDFDACIEYVERLAAA